MKVLTPLKQFAIHEVKAEFKGFFQVKRVVFKHALYRGDWSPLIEREVFCRGQAVVVLLYDSQNEVVVLIEQLRPGALMQANNAGLPSEQAWLLEPVAGMIDLGESSHEAGIREAQEEAGVSVETLEYVCQFYPSPGACDEVLHLYAADINADALGDYAGLAEHVEDIKIVKLSFSDAKKMLLNAQFQVATTYIALQWLFFQKLSSSNRV